MLFDKVRNFDRFKFEIIIGICIVFILLFALYRKITGKKGTWTSIGKNRYVDVAKNILRTNALNKMELPIQPKRDMRGMMNYDNTEYQPYPFIKESKGEIECRRALESILKKPFSKARPDFLRNEVTGGVYNMELDCYNPELKIAVEYNGQQHYRFIPYFHRNKDRFINQRYRDVLKRKLCEENGITLIEVPYTIAVNDIENFLRKKLREIAMD
jgi:hypothetical protein